MLILKKILVLGGDRRFLTVANEISVPGYNVDRYISDNDENIMVNNNEKYDIIISGLPLSRDGIYLNAPFISKKISISEALKRIKRNGYFLGGIISAEITKMCASYEINAIDYYKNDILTEKNIIPTVEGAISLAVSESEITLNDSKCLVTGYGRIGKHLAYILKFLGASVYIAVRNQSIAKDIAMAGYTPVNIIDIKKYIGKVDFIFNTVPARIIDNECLDKINTGTIIMELASAPGGFNCEYAVKNGKTVIYGNSLPGRFSPVTAGKIIKEAVTDIIKEVTG